MGNPWMKFLAEERDKDENKDVPPMELSSHVRPKYDAWKAANGIDSSDMSVGKKHKKTMKKNKRRRNTMKKKRRRR